MSLFYNNEIRTNTTYPVDSLIHTFNKKVFNDYEEAKEMLLKKVLLPGEVAFGYYQDPDAEHGINVIFAVGPVKSGTGNTIFKNPDEINNQINNQIEIIRELQHDIENMYVFHEI